LGVLVEATKLTNTEEDCERVKGSLALALKPVFPGFAAPVIRFKTFGMWPKGLQPKPAQLSDAGFFYTGFVLKIKSQSEI